MSKSPDICSNCGKQNQSDSPGSLTQWVFLCKCDTTSSDKITYNTIRICLNCGRRIGAGRSGTFTQWIFRADVCDCENPQPVEKSIRSLSDSEFESTSVDLSSVVEIDVDKKQFPIERFAPIEMLGSTQDSTVYLAIDRMLGTRVAIKSVSLQKADDIIRFQKEAKALSSLSHQGIVKVFDFAEQEGTPYMVMEFVDGVTLREFLDMNSKMSIADALVVVKNLCQTLSYCHSKNVFHRDIKPENILVCANSEPLEIKLVDFGLACTYDTVSKQGDTVAGTPPYMAPDVSKGKTYDARSELYSVGCVLFELLTGAPPYEAENPLQLMKMHADAAIPALNLSKEDNTFDIQLEDIVFKCLAKNPEDRFESMDELLSVIESSSMSSLEELESPPIEEDLEQTDIESAIERNLDPFQSEKGNVKALFGVLGLMLVFSAVSFYLINQEISEENNTKEFPELKANYDEDHNQAVLADKYRFINQKNQESSGVPKLNDAHLRALMVNPDPAMKKIILNSDKKVSVSRLAAFFKGVKLETVTLGNQLCNPEYIKTISNEKDLRFLRLVGPDLEDVEAIPVNMKRLKMIALNNTKVSGEYIKSLKRISRLDHLRFNFCDLDNGTISEISKMPIKHLSFANCTFFLEDFVTLSKVKPLIYIRLKNLTVLGSSQSSIFKKHSSIPVEFFMSGEFILSSHGDSLSEAPEKLFKAVSQTNAHHLYIENMIFNKAILSALEKMHSLNKIDFRRCSIESGAKESLKRAIPGIKIIDNYSMSVKTEKYRKK